MSRTIHDFFSQWDIYRLCLEHNTLHHREVARILSRELASCHEPFRFLDLASGDAHVTATALAGTQVASYTAVDFSAPALELARVHTAELPAPGKFLLADFREFLAVCADTFDITYLGLSLHHLAEQEKFRAFENLRRITRTLYLFEPILHGGETREECLARWHRAMDGPYDAFPPAARAAIWEHVRTSDFPEAQCTYLDAARAAGFSGAENLFTDRENFYSLFRFTA